MGGGHTRRRITENIKVLALRLLYGFDKHISSLLLLRNNNLDRLSRRLVELAKGSTRFTGLHGVAFLGIADIAAAVLDMKKRGFGAADFTGKTALTWAAKRGHDEVVKMLLKRKDVDPNRPNTCGSWTPLS